MKKNSPITIISKEAGEKSIFRKDYNKLVQLLKKYREQRALSQADLAMLIGQDQTFVSKYETKLRRLDIVETMDICDALEIDIIQLIYELRQKK